MTMAFLDKMAGADVTAAGDCNRAVWSLMGLAVLKSALMATLDDYDGLKI